MKTVSFITATTLCLIAFSSKSQTVDAVKIGTKVWMSKNLNVSTFRNGDPIQEIVSDEEWAKAAVKGIPAWCYYGYNPANGIKYGKLYNWYAVNDPRGLGPEGWHVPSNAEWKMLEDYLGGSSVASGKMKERGKTHWKKPNTSATNESGFSALPGGYCAADGYYDGMGSDAYFWSSTAGSESDAIGRHLYYDNSRIAWWFSTKRSGFSVRCVKGPEATILSSPLNDINLSETRPFFDWSDVSGIYVYELLVDNSADFSSPEINQTSLSSSEYKTPDSLSDGVYYWKVRSWDSEGNQSDWSKTRMFVIQKFETGTVTDIDGNTYKTIKIGDQVWMAENLKVTHFRDGSKIPNIINQSWKHLASGAYCNYENNETHVSDYGRLYNWYAVSDFRNIAPAGWHVPGIEEWSKLIDYLGGWRNAYNKMKETGTVHWVAPNTDATNEIGFSALPGGFRNEENNFMKMGTGSYFWSTTELKNPIAAWAVYFRHNDPVVRQGDHYKVYGFSVRCVRNN